jgi:AcrR family transcriptional regulator
VPPAERRPNRRDLQSAATREAIVSAASTLMLERGYVDTSITAVAQAAGVAVQTVYNSVGSKADLLSAIVDRTAAGPAAPTLVPALMRARVAETSTAEQVIDLLADWFVEVNVRAAALHRVIRQAAAVDRAAADVEQRRAIQRLHNYSEAAGALRQRNGLRSGLTDAEAAAAIWSTGHPQVYRTLVLEVGWSLGAYREWLGKTLTAQLT